MGRNPQGNYEESNDFAERMNQVLDTLQIEMGANSLLDAVLKLNTQVKQLRQDIDLIFTRLEETERKASNPRPRLYK